MKQVILTSLLSWLFAAAALATSPETAEEHWAYVKPVRPSPPVVEDAAWPRNPIDFFTLARMEEEGLSPSPEGDRSTLIRRLSLDLTGLPPSVEEVDAFLADSSPSAYEDLVDRLLDSPHYGERQARPWLDLARYGDTNGYEKDLPRSLWPWREWVIDAYNRNLPFDQFTIEQIAGDMLPDATPSQKIASGFHRNSLLNNEGGIHLEEFRVAAVMDRVDVTSTVWMGTTMDCAQCHNHRSDPISMREYYEFYAFFNQSEDNGRDFQPELSLPSPAQAERQHEIEAKIEKWREKLPEAEENETDKVESLREKLDALNAQKSELIAEIPTTLIMKEREEPRETRLFMRGDWRTPGPSVPPGVPDVLHPLPEDEPRNRLTLARWLVDEENPLVARVTVNRMWEQTFGNGLVATAEDFGIEGTPPTHPELLDWLATEFMRTGWDMKAFHRLVVTSATYRQSSQATPEKVQRDPRNLLLSRGPRFRVEAEMIRDIALTVSGRLERSIGGPSNFPPQPPGIWENSFSFYDTEARWVDDTGPERYRRGIYTYWRRTAPFPPALIFDTQTRDLCSVKRIRTNTPLQALNTLNDLLFVEAAGGLARRVLTEPASTLDDRLSYAFRLCVARPPEDTEKEVLAGLYSKALAYFQENREAAGDLITQSRIQKGELNVSELAAWIVLGNTLLNMDETLTKS